jgi:hypothetical protein
MVVVVERRQALLMAITGMAGLQRSALPSGENNRRSYAILNG